MVRALIKSLLGASPPVPFIFGLAGCPSNLAAELHELLDGNDLALLSPFTPQMTILRHPATGWFLTHGGSNSMSEAMLTGMPLVAWPISADQPVLSTLCALLLSFASSRLLMNFMVSSVSEPQGRH